MTSSNYIERPTQSYESTYLLESCARITNIVYKTKRSQNNL